MARYINQIVNSMSVLKLKGIEQLKDLTFTPKPVTAILGENCIGKSSILYALASCYQPEEVKPSKKIKNDKQQVEDTKPENHRMSEYLKPNPHALWDGTSYEISFEFTDQSSKGVTKDTRTYAKATDRWSPRYVNRPYRPVYFIGIHTTLPVLEYINFIKNKSKVGSQRIRYTTTELEDDVAKSVLEKVCYIFNRQYTHIYKHKITGWTEDLYGLAIDGMTYSQISMGAGEQRVLKILFTIFSANEHSLILIDELDLLLHETAFQKIIKVINERAKSRKIQVIFTTHRESVLKQSSDLNIRYLKKINGETKVLEHITPNALSDLTGELEKSVTIYVEDKLSARIIRTIARHLKSLRNIQIVEFGAAQNVFTITAGVIVDSPNRDILSVIDGDIFREEKDKQHEINKVLTGSAIEAKENRNKVLNRIFQYNLPQGKSPEEYIRECILNIPKEDYTDEYHELFDALSNVKVVLNKHNYIDEIYTHYDEDENVIVSHIISMFAKTPEWDGFISDVKNELKSILTKLHIFETANIETQLEMSN
ncbi:AAA family ATPase [Vibrio fluvialis]|uniref:AAA family ATPase n=1 Tax=Vibrio fluvialis TaxID=676 RepID=UPI003D7E0CE0